MSLSCWPRCSSVALAMATIAVAAVLGQSAGPQGEVARAADPCGSTVVYAAATDAVFDAVLAYVKTIEDTLEANRKTLQIKWFKPKTEADKASGVIVHRFVIRRGAGSAVSPASYEVVNRTFWVRPAGSGRSRMTTTIRAYGWWDAPKPMRPGSHEQVYNWSLWGCEAPELKLAAAVAAGAGGAVP